MDLDVFLHPWEHRVDLAALDTAHGVVGHHRAINAIISGSRAGHAEASSLTTFELDIRCPCGRQHTSTVLVHRLNDLCRWSAPRLADIKAGGSILPSTAPAGITERRHAGRASTPLCGRRGCFGIDKLQRTGRSALRMARWVISAICHR